jgi:myo-inositol 2-dehydrogenase / D-chiro-inositol 1-dehydrogenase
VTTVALCGAGMIAGAHALAATVVGAPVVAVASRTLASAERVAGPARARVVPYEELPAGADIVVVSTPPPRHVGDALAALRAGAAVVLEKPLCTTLAGADLLVEAAGPRLLYAENLAYAPVVQAMLRLVSRLGPLTNLEVRALQGRPTGGGPLTEAWGGGALFDLGVHPLAVAMLLARPARVVSVRATLGGAGDHPTDEHAVVSLTFDSGLVGSVVSSWRAGPTPHWDAQVASATGVLRAELLPEPDLEVDGTPVPLPEVTQPVAAIEQYGYVDQFLSYLADLSVGRTPFMDARFGRSVLDVVCAAYASARSGDAVPVPFEGRRDLTPLQLWKAG